MKMGILPIISVEWWEEKRLSEERRFAWIRGRAIRPFPCKVCGLFCCTCQSKLPEFMRKNPVMLKSLCHVCGLFLCDCHKDGRGFPVLGLNND